MLEGLLAAHRRYDELSAQLSQPDAASDIGRYRALMKEYKELEPLSRQYLALAAAEEALAEAKELLYSHDAELSAMAAEQKAEAEAEITRLTEEGFVDQARFAQSFVRGKHRLKQWGRLRIERELRARDIPEALIASALEEIEPQEYDRNFERLFLQRVEAVGGLSSTAQVAKVYRYLLARGYDPADIWEAINVKRKEKGEKP